MNISSDLADLGIFKPGRKKKTKTEKSFDSIYQDALTYSYSKPSEYIITMWDRWKKSSIFNKDLNGKIFEVLIAIVFYRENIRPFYQQASLAFVPNALFDFILYTGEAGIISISIKTSLRERYKQADLEAYALRIVHKNAQCHLITLDEKEAERVTRKIKKNECLGLHNVVVGNSVEFDDYIENLKSFNFSEPGKVPIITTSNCKIS